jgi:hypothetical protein
LVELLVSITITVIIIIPLLVFITDISSEIWFSNKKTEIISEIYNIEDKILEIKWKYLSGVILINNNSWSWSDVLLLRTKNWETKKEWYIFAQINYNNLLIDWSWNIDNIWEKYLAYRKISSTELTELESNPNNVYNYKFHLDKVFKWILLNNFQLDYYNNNSILELSFFNFINYDWIWLIKKYSEIKKSEIQKYILNF